MFCYQILYNLHASLWIYIYNKYSEEEFLAESVVKYYVLLCSEILLLKMLTQSHQQCLMWWVIIKFISFWIWWAKKYDTIV